MIIEATGKLVIDSRAQEWCELPYPGHPRGCPNYGQKMRCPPFAPYIEDVYDFEQPCWFVVIDFDLKAQAERMKAKHPGWTEKQCRCLLYWQAGVNKRLKEELIVEARSRFPYIGWRISMVPEAMGIHVIKTLQSLGVPIKERPTDTVYKAGLIWVIKKKERANA